MQMLSNVYRLVPPWATYLFFGGLSCLLHFLALINVTSLPVIWNSDLSFDFDQLPQIERWITLSAAELAGAPLESEFLLRHPAGYLPRLVFQPLLMLGFSAGTSISIVLSIMFAASVLLCRMLAHAARFSGGVAWSAAISLALTTSALWATLVLDTYSFSFLLLLAAIVSASGNRGSLQWTTTLLVIFAALVTVTNLLLLIAIYLVDVALAQRERRYVIRKAAQGLAMSVAAVLILAFLHALLFGVGGNLLWDDGARRAYWIIADAIKAGPLQVMQTFFAFSLVAPEFTIVKVDAAIPTFVDFRDFSFGLVGALGLGVALVCQVVGGVAVISSRHRGGLICLVWIAMNFALHLVWQSKGSVFLFSLHVAPATLFVAAVGAQHLMRKSKHWHIPLGIGCAALVSNNVLAGYQYLAHEPMLLAASRDAAVAQVVCQGLRRLDSAPSHVGIGVSLSAVKSLCN